MTTENYRNNRLQRAMIKILCYTPVIPAAMVNIANEQPLFMKAGNIGIVLGAAVFLEACVHTKKGKGVRLLFAKAFLICLLCSLLNGLQNGSHNSAAHADFRQGEINQGARLQVQLKELDEQLAYSRQAPGRARRKGGRQPPDELEGELQALTTGSPLWHRSKECVNATVGESQAFCGPVVRPQGKEGGGGGARPNRRRAQDGPRTAQGPKREARCVRSTTGKRRRIRRVCREPVPHGSAMR